jgi:4-azaleucine resistance transporter AzlC
MPRDAKRALEQGLAAAAPICIGYVPLGCAFGVLSHKAGFHVVETGLMSLMVYAGSAQFIAVSMLNASASIVSIVITTFAVNLRHVLMSSALARFLEGLPDRWTYVFAYGVTDESFAVNLTKFRDEEWTWPRALVVNHLSNAVWITSSIAGAFAGRFIPDGAFGIDYALIAMFICLLVVQLKGPLTVITAAFSGVLAVVLSLLFGGSAHVVIASVCAATFGLMLGRTRLLKPEESFLEEKGSSGPPPQKL